MMRHVTNAALAIGLAACGNSAPDIGPDTTTTAAATSSASTVSTSTSSGAGGSTSSTSGTGGTSAMGGLYESGSRLRARYLLGDDGAKQFNGWHDATRNEDCSLMVANDGQTRCLPAASGGAGTYFTDAGCSQPGIPLACPTTYASMSAYSSGCPSLYTTRVFALGAKVGDTFYSGSPGSCSPQSLPGYSVYALGAEVQPSEFAKATEAVE